VSFSKPRLTILLAAASVTLLMQAPVALAFNFGDMMSPNKWMGGNKNNNDDYYDDRDYPAYGPPPGAYGPSSYGAPYGPGGYGPAPYGAPGYGAPGYGAPGAWAPGTAPAPSQITAPPPALPSAPAPSTSNAKASEIDALKRRIEQLEAKQAPPPAYASPSSSPDRGPLPGQARGMGYPPPPAPSGPAASAPNFRPMDKN